jgi:hypothetical protein
VKYFFSVLLVLICMGYIFVFTFLFRAVELNKRVRKINKLTREQLQDAIYINCDILQLNVTPALREKLIAKNKQYRQELSGI